MGAVSGRACVSVPNICGARQAATSAEAVDAQMHIHRSQRGARPRGAGLSAYRRCERCGYRLRQQLAEDAF